MGDKLIKCRNCGELPRFIKSDFPGYNVLLSHESTTCPPPYGLLHYDSNKRNAIARWNSLNKSPKGTP